MTPLEGALWLIRRGFPVFPADHPGTEQCSGIGRGHDPATCTDRGKHPCVPFTRAHTLDEDQAHSSIGARLRNVGIAVGACSGPNGARLLVVDSDRPNAIEDAAAAFGYRHTPTMRVTTAKGHHDYYWAPASTQLGNGLGALRGKFDGDVRSGNGYVIGPGSVHATGVVYELVDPEQPPMELPAWLLAALQTTPARAADAAATGPAPKAEGRLTPLVRFVLESADGERNNRLYWAACRAFDQRADDGPAVASALLAAASHIGLPEGEARQTITSAYRARATR